MPFKSEDQRKAMYAAAKGKSTIGIPKSVGEKFIEHKDDAAGVLHHKNGKILLIKRATTSTNRPGYWAFPGGHIVPGESPYAAAARETWEEVGHHTISALPLGRFDSDGIGFHAFLAEDSFTPILNDESTDYGWFDLKQLPTPLIPACRTIIASVFPDCGEMTELDVMQKIRDGLLPSPQRCGNLWLFALRVTGTGLAERPTGEIAHKSPADYLTNEFLSRCNGLPVVWEHPKNKLLDSESFRNQIIGTSSLPYVDGDEVWTIARIYDGDAAKLMQENQLSTSPAVSVGASAIKQGDVLIEGNPVFVDHIAVCAVGVWDKGTPDGVRIDSMNEVSIMEEEKLGVEAPLEHEDPIEKLTKMIEALAAKIDAKHDEPHNKIDAAHDSGMNDCADSDDEGLDKEEKAEVKEEVKEEIEETHHTVADSDSDKKEEKEEAKEESKEEDEEVKDDSARADSLAEMKRELAELRRMTAERSIDERETIAKAQARADSVAMALGETGGVSPLAGESAFSYRKRIAARFAQFSERFKGVDVSNISDAALFAPVEDAIYADSMAYAKAPPMAEGRVQMIESRDDAGRMVRTPTANSDPRAWMGVFSNGANYVGSIRV